MHTQKLVHHEHLHTLHRGVGLTMTSVRSQHWVPCLRKLAKWTICACHGCKRFQAKSGANLPPGNLPGDLTPGSHPFQVIGVDYARSIKCKKRGKVDSKAYIVLYACSLCHALYLDLVSSLETQEFILSLKTFIARKGRPDKFTLKIVLHLLVQLGGWERLWVMKSSASSLPRTKSSGSSTLVTPLCGVHNLRGWLDWCSKSTSNKVRGSGILSWQELEEVLLDVEITLNDPPEFLS